MTTERSDKLHSDWRASTEKFDYFFLGMTSALCAFIAQGYKPARLGMNPTSLELIALFILVFGVLAGFRRIEQTLMVTALNHRLLHANEARGGMIAKMQVPSTFINEATGQIFTPAQALRCVEQLTATIDAVQPELDAAKIAAFKRYRHRNLFTLSGFLLLLSARVWSAYI